MRLFIFMISMIIAHSLYGEWVLDQLYKGRDSVYDHSIAIRNNGVHFFEYRDSEYYMYHYDFEHGLVDSIKLNPGIDSNGYAVFTNNYIIQTKDYLYVNGRHRPSRKQRFLRIDPDNYSNTIDLTARYDSLVNTVRDWQYSFGVNNSVKVNGVESIIISFDDQYYHVIGDSVIKESNLSKEDRTYGDPIEFIDDTTVFQRVPNHNNFRYQLRTTKWPSKEINYVLSDILPYFPINAHVHMTLSDTIFYTISHHYDSKITQVSRYDTKSNLQQYDFKQYYTNFARINSNNNGGYLLSLEDGRIFDSDVSVDEPIFTMDTSNAQPMWVEKINNQEYLITSSDGLFKLKQSSSVITSFNTSALPCAIYDLSGRIVYQGTAVEEKLKQLDRGLYIVVIDGSGKLRWVE